MPNYLSLVQVAILCQEHPTKTFARITRGELNAVRIGSRWFLEDEEVREFLAKRATAAGISEDATAGVR